jgi:hypothetical protein
MGMFFIDGQDMIVFLTVDIYSLIVKENSDEAWKLFLSLGLDPQVSLKFTVSCNNLPDYKELSAIISSGISLIKVAVAYRLS